MNNGTLIEFEVLSGRRHPELPGAPARATWDPRGRLVRSHGPRRDLDNVSSTYAPDTFGIPAQNSYSFFYPLLSALPFLLHAAPGPRPRHTTEPPFCWSRNTLRIMSRLTPGHARSNSASVKSPGYPAIAASTSALLAPRGVFMRPARSSNSR